MAETILQLDTRDNVVVALATLEPGAVARINDAAWCTARETIPAKQKMAVADLEPGDLIFMYGMVVGEAVERIQCGGLLTTRNIRHRAGRTV